MPKVGNKHFSYTPAGYASAEKARKQKRAKLEKKVKTGLKKAFPNY